MVTFFGMNLCTWMLRHDPVCVSINGYVWCMFMCLAKVYYWNFISIIGTETPECFNPYGSIIIVSHFQCVPMLSAKLGHWSISSTCTRYTYTFQANDTLCRIRYYRIIANFINKPILFGLHSSLSSPGWSCRKGSKRLQSDNNYGAEKTENACVCIYQPKSS